ncbi:hypothetical protein EJB05_33845 [Eragrostis curvula]|uniref:RING-type E3 ubiquitin transferase n=1 Tax=Eragrostis curvula TaxID=38414 RepID=A0A5J9U3G5_9POAL|nr:hypothetical protein EJB05_33845 [Eragrostis curvula]
MEQDGLCSWEQAAKRARLLEQARPSAWPAAQARAQPDSARPVRAWPDSGHSAAPGDLTVDDTDLLYCGICCLPLKPPVFQCNSGHVVCSVCRDKLIARGKCHVCGISTGDYSRCHDMDRLLEKIRVIKCPNAVYGCTARPAYYDKHSHCRTCPHAPCYCPGKDCGFSGSTTALWDHFAGVHGWPCAAMIMADDSRTLCLYEGLNFFLINFDADGAQDATTSPTAGNQWLFLLNVVRQPLDRVISMLCIHPHTSVDEEGPSSKGVECNLWYSNFQFANNRHKGDRLIDHYQMSTFRVPCTDLSNGLPNQEDCFRFVVPKSVLEDREDVIEVQAKITIK